MTDWRGRLEAVVTLGLPPEPKDGEVQCINPTCRNTRLNRKDMTCWRCGGDRFAPASDEMRHALRFNYVPPPRRVENPKEPPQAQQISVATLFGLPFPFPPTAPTLPGGVTSVPVGPSIADALKRYQDEYEAAYQRAASMFYPAPAAPSQQGVRPGDTVKVRLPERYAKPAPPPSGLASRIRGWFRR